MNLLKLDLADKQNEVPENTSSQTFTFNNVMNTVGPSVMEKLISVFALSFPAPGT